MRIPVPAAVTAAALVPLLLGSLVATAAWADEPTDPAGDPTPVVESTESTSEPPAEHPAEPTEQPQQVETITSTEPSVTTGAEPSSAPVESSDPVPTDEPAVAGGAADEPPSVTPPVAQAIGSSADLTSPAIPPGESREIGFSVPAGATRLMVLVVGDRDVTGAVHGPVSSWSMIRDNNRDYLSLVNPPAGEWRLVLTNTGDEPLTVSYDIAIGRAELEMGIATSYGGPGLFMEVFPRVGGVVQPGLTVRARITGPNGFLREVDLNWTPGTPAYTRSVTDLPVGSYTIYAWTVVEGETYETVGWTRIALAESDPPIVDLTTVPAAPNALGWFARPVAVTITGSDSGAGMWSVLYSLDGAEPVERYTDSTSVTIGHGVHGLEYWARDAQNNHSEHETRTFRVDTGFPIVELAAPADGARYEVGEEVVVDLECQDELSGIRECDTPVEDGELLDTSTPGEYAFEVVAVDAAGNITRHAIRYLVEEVDESAPSVSADLPEEPASGWYREPVPVVIEASDEETGIDRIVWTVDGEEFVEEAEGAEFIIEEPGEHEVEYWAVDEAGNQSERVSFTVRIDPDAPTVTIRVPEAAAALGLAPLEPGQFRQGSVVAADFECADELSGIADCVGSTPDGTPLPTSTVGRHTFTVVATDVAGNSVERVVEYEVVAAAPAPVPAETPRAGLAVTGPELGPWFAVAALLLLSGLGIVAIRVRQL